MWLLTVFMSWDSVTLGNNFFLIYTRALCCYHSLCLFYMVLSCYYGLCMFLIWQLASIKFCSCILNWYLPFQYHLLCIAETPLAPSHWPPCSFYCGRPSKSVLLCCTPHTSCHTLGTALAGGSPTVSAQLLCGGPVHWCSCFVIFYFLEYFDFIKLHWLS